MDDHTKDVIDMSQRTKIEYQRVGFEVLDPECLYCGETAEVGDHVLPVVHVNQVGVHPELAHLLLIVPACRECNYIAAGHVFLSIYDKQQYIHDGLRRRYARLLHSPKWSDSPGWDDDFGPTLATFLRSQDQRRSQLTRRLAWKLPSAIGAVELASDG